MLFVQLIFIRLELGSHGIVGCSFDPVVARAN